MHVRGRTDRRRRACGPHRPHVAVDPIPAVDIDCAKHQCLKREPSHRHARTHRTSQARVRAVVNGGAVPGAAAFEAVFNAVMYLLETGWFRYQA